MWRFLKTRDFFKNKKTFAKNKKKKRKTAENSRNRLVRENKYAFFKRTDFVGNVEISQNNKVDEKIHKNPFLILKLLKTENFVENQRESA